MKTKGILQRARKWWDSVGHWGRLSRAASNRSFLLRERKKALMRLGEKAHLWFHEQKSRPQEFTRLVEQVDKIDRLLNGHDYGGKDGVDFHSKAKKNERKRES